MTCHPIRKRAVLVVGAGASIEYGAPSTHNLTAEIERKVMNDDWMKHCGGDKAFQFIKGQLEGYLRQPSDVNFEHIYHCAHELSYFVMPSAGALNEYRPLLQPFLKLQDGLSPEALRPLCDKIVDVIYTTVSTASGANPLDLGPLSRFLEDLQSDFVTRIYTTNYDDFILQAAPHLYTGFPQAPSGGPKKFELKEYWAHENDHAVFHLHGAVHLGFPHPSPPDSEIGDLIGLTIGQKLFDIGCFMEAISCAWMELRSCAPRSLPGSTSFRGSSSVRFPTIMPRSAVT